MSQWFVIHENTSFQNWCLQPINMFLFNHHTLLYSVSYAQCTMYSMVYRGLPYRCYAKYSVCHESRNAQCMILIKPSWWFRMHITCKYMHVRGYDLYMHLISSYSFGLRHVWYQFGCPAIRWTWILPRGREVGAGDACIVINAENASERWQKAKGHVNENHPSVPHLMLFFHFHWGLCPGLGQWMNSYKRSMAVSLPLSERLHMPVAVRLQSPYAVLSYDGKTYVQYGTHVLFTCAVCAMLHSQTRLTAQCERMTQTWCSGVLTRWTETICFIFRDACQRHVGLQELPSVSMHLKLHESLTPAFFISDLW